MSYLGPIATDQKTTAPHQAGTRAALFQLLRKPQPSAARIVTEGAKPLAAPPPTLQSPPPQSPVPQNPAPQSMVSGTVGARFAYALGTAAPMQPVILSMPKEAFSKPDRAKEAGPALPSHSDAEALQARQKRLQEALMDDMFIF